MLTRASQSAKAMTASGHSRWFRPRRHRRIFPQFPESGPKSAAAGDSVWRRLGIFVIGGEAAFRFAKSRQGTGSAAWPERRAARCRQPCSGFGSRQPNQGSPGRTGGVRHDDAGDSARTNGPGHRYSARGPLASADHEKGDWASLTVARATSSRPKLGIEKIGAQARGDDAEGIVQSSIERQRAPSTNG